MTLVNLFEGEMFAGKYRVLNCFATGGMGAVYEVVHINTNCHHALKVMKPEIINKEDLRERFKREARVPAKIDSKYVVKVYDSGVDEKTQMLFLVMELLQGQDLGKRLSRTGKFSFKETIEYLWQTARALDKAHRANIVHRDLKPDNLFLCESDDEPPYIKVLDFGIAKFMAEQGAEANMTQAVGTPLYMAPEQLAVGSAISPATDIYALGMMAYTLLVGVPYWADEQQQPTHLYAFFLATIKGPQEAPTRRARRRDVVLPAAFDEWFAQATSSAQEQRFRSASVAVKGLAIALGLPEPQGLGSQTTESTGVYAISSLTSPSSPTPTSSGQTTPGPVSSGQTWPNRTSSEPQTGTVLLDECASTSGNGPGLSSSQPRMSTGPSGLSQTRPSESSAIPTRKSPKSAIVALALAACAIAIGVTVVVLKNTTVPTNALAAAQLPSAQSVKPEVLPTESITTPTTTPVASAVNKEHVEPPDTPPESTVDAGVDAGVDAAVDAGKTKIKLTSPKEKPTDPIGAF